MAAIEGINVGANSITFGLTMLDQSHWRVHVAKAYAESGWTAEMGAEHAPLEQDLVGWVDENLNRLGNEAAAQITGTSPAGIDVWAEPAPPNLQPIDPEEIFELLELGVVWMVRGKNGTLPVHPGHMAHTTTLKNATRIRMLGSLQLDDDGAPFRYLPTEVIPLTD